MHKNIKINKKANIDFLRRAEQNIFEKKNKIK